MKNARILIATALLLAAVSVYVQAQERQLLTATVPFAFTVENSNLPAGAYTVSTLPPYNMIKVQSADGRKVAMIFSIASVISTFWPRSGSWGATCIATCGAAISPVSWPEAVKRSSPQPFSPVPATARTRNLLHGHMETGARLGARFLSQTMPRFDWHEKVLQKFS